MLEIVLPKQAMTLLEEMNLEVDKKDLERLKSKYGL